MIVTVKTPNKNYDVIIDKLEKIELKTKVTIITNETVCKLHIDYLKNKLYSNDINTIVIKDGEMYKNISTIEQILDQCFVNQLDRKSILIAFGGGVVGDMTGFAASIYQRGIDFIQIPTTLLSQVDASVGGKTGINNKHGKNLIGTFHQPHCVYIDSYFLKTLPSREFSAGVSEIIKMAVCFDKKLFTWLENNHLDCDDNINYAIEQSIKIKSSVINLDEKENGIRAALNYGHTFGHVIEKKTLYKKYLHGEAVSIGIIMANKLAMFNNLMNQDEYRRVENLLEKYDLPISYRISNPLEFHENFYLDKKSSKGKIKFILPKGIGECVIRDNIEKSLVLKVLEEYCI